MALPGILRRLLEHINTKAAHGLAVGRKFSVSGGATADPVTFYGTEDVDLVVTSLDMSKMTGGVLPVANGGTGRVDGKATAWTEPRTITLYGDVLGATAFDGSANIDLVTSIGLALAPRPQAAAGLGQWMKVTCVMSFGKSIYSLPAGGSWAYYGLEILNKADGEGGFNGIASITAKIGIAAGGTALSNLYPGAGILEALCWRIA